MLSKALFCNVESQRLSGGWSEELDSQEEVEGRIKSTCEIMTNGQSLRELVLGWNTFNQVDDVKVVLE